MIRALIELIFAIVVLIAARAILTTVLGGLINIGRQGSVAQQQNNAAQPSPAGRELHKDPVCGTYVADSTGFQRHTAGQTFYYCSDECRKKHSLAVRT